jgi:tetratricopeptide (TPR) repeat protein
VDLPRPPLGLPAQTTLTLAAGDGHLVASIPVAGTFREYLQPDGSLHEEDSHARYLPVRDTVGALAGFADVRSIVSAAILAAGRGQRGSAERFLALVTDTAAVELEVGRAVVDVLTGDRASAERRVRGLTGYTGLPPVEVQVNRAGYLLLRAQMAEQALPVFVFNTRVFPDSFNAWDSLGEAYVALGRTNEAIRAYERSLALNPRNTSAAQALERIRR